MFHFRSYTFKFASKMTHDLFPSNLGRKRERKSHGEYNYKITLHFSVLLLYNKNISNNLLIILQLFHHSNLTHMVGNTNIFFILPTFFIILSFHPPNQTKPKSIAISWATSSLKSYYLVWARPPRCDAPNNLPFNPLRRRT